MTVQSDERLFDAVRTIKGKALTQSDVDAINAALAPVGNASAAKNGRAIALIKRFEGCRLSAYVDPGTGGEPITIGWGATGGFKLGTMWTQAQADERLASDVAKFADGVDGLIGKATPGQRAAMISFAYNVGLGALRSSTLLRKHLAGDYGGAKAEFARWNRAGGRAMQGLTNRRMAEAAEYSA